MSAARACTSEFRIPAGSAASRRRLAQVALFVLALPLATLTAQQNKPTQYDVEAAYLLNFAKFIRWPQGSVQRSLSICVLGDDSLAAVLDRILGGEQVDGRPVTEKRVTRADEVSDCSILYVSSSQASQASRLLAAVEGQPVLTVSDMPGFLDRGGIIQFVLLENRVRFAVNLEPTTRDGLMLSSDLLKVAMKVREPKAGH